MPGAPTGVTGTPGNGQVSVGFTAPARRRRPDHAVHRHLSPGGATCTGPASPITVTGLTNGTSLHLHRQGHQRGRRRADLGPLERRHATHRARRSRPARPATPGNAPGDGQLHGPRLERRRPDHLLHGHLVAGGLTATGTASPLTVTGLTNGTSYTFTVRATNAAGDGPSSSSSNAVTPRTVPGKPTGVTGTPGNGQVSVGFTAPADGGAPITQYTVTVSPGGATFTGPASPIAVTGLTNGTSLHLHRQGHQRGGRRPDLGPLGRRHATHRARRSHRPVRDTRQRPGDRQLHAPASNGGAAITSYTVTSSPGGFTESGTASPLTVTGLTNGTSYTFTVKATNAAGDGPPSAPSNAVTPRTVPGAPTHAGAAPGDQQGDRDVPRAVRRRRRRDHLVHRHLVAGRHRRPPASAARSRSRA